MSSENSKTSDSHRLLLNISDKINLKRSDKYAALSSISIYCTSKDQLQSGVINLNYLKVHILYQIFKNILSILSKSMKE